jgi:hydrogenase 3 maturation protease
MAVKSFEEEIKALLKGAKKTVVMAVGDELDPRDCLGHLAGRRISALDLKGVEVLLTSQMPENFTSVVRRMKPSHVVLIDAAEMGMSPGEVAIIDAGRISATRVSTHAMPLSVLMEYLQKEMKVEVALVGIQPTASEEYGEAEQPPAIQKGIERIANGIKAATSSRTR